MQIRTQNVKYTFKKLPSSFISHCCVTGCNPPQCPPGFEFQPDDNCECVRESRSESQCPNGFPAAKALLSCFCLCENDPVCPENAPIFDRDSCKCRFSAAPSCPSNTSLKGNGYCQGGSELPPCPMGYFLLLRGMGSCVCVVGTHRRCSGTLNDDACFCTQRETQPPSCPSVYNLPSSARCALDISKCECSVQCK